MFNGENLTNLRTMHGYSRKQLSSILGVTEQAVWQYENNYTSPKMNIINQLKAIFNVKSTYFYSNDVLNRYTSSENIPITNIAYRSKERNVISKTQSEAKYMAYLDSFINYLSLKIKYPTQKIMLLRDKVIHYLNTSKEDRETQIEKVANLARQELGLDHHTNDNLMFLVEKSGVFISEKAIGKEIDAYSLWTRQERPFIILGNLKKSAVRRNFDIAHELGHLLLHYRVEFTSLDKDEYKNIEKEANLFAGAFLLPKEEFSQDIQLISHLTNPDAYLDLKEKWKTSLQVLGYRAARLEIMNAKNHRNYYAALHRKGYLKMEPLDNIIPIQTPQKIKSIIDFGSKQGLINIRHMMERDWLADVVFFENLTGIDARFFSHYIEKQQDFELVHMVDVISNNSI